MDATFTYDPLSLHLDFLFLLTLGLPWLPSLQRMVM